MNTEYQNLLDEIHLLEACLHPPAYEVSMEEHVKAKVRYFFDNCLYEKFHDLSSFVEFSQLPNEKQISSKVTQIKDRAIKSKEEIQSMFFSSDDYWNTDEKTNQAITLLSHALSHAHYGACTGIPQACERCYAETIYKLPSTKNWSNEEGAELYQRLKNLKDMEKQIRLAQSLEQDLHYSDIESKNNKSKL